MVSSQIDIREFQTEFINYVNMKLYSLDPLNRITQTTKTFSGTGSETHFLLDSKLRYIASVSVGGTPLNYGDYKPVFDADSNYLGYIEFTNAPAEAVDNISITYGYGPGWIYNGFPRKDLSLGSYPRVGVGYIETPVEGGLGGGTNHILRTQVRISVMMLSENTRDLDKFDYTLKNNITKDAKNFYNWRYIRPDAMRDFELGDDATGDVVARNRDYLILDRFEIVAFNN